MQKKINIQKILIFLIPLSFVIGPLVLELLLLILSFLFLKEMYLTKNFNFFNNFFSYIFFGFSLYLIFSMIIFSRYGIGINYSLFYFRYGVYILALYYFFLKEDLLKLFILIFLSLNFFLCFDAIFQHYFGFNIIGIEKFNNLRVSSLFADELILGSFILKISPIIYSYIFFNFKNNKFINYLISILVVLNLYVISLSGERSALFMYLAYLFYLLIFLKYQVYKKLIVSVIILISLSLIFSISDNVYERIIKKTYYEVMGKPVKNDDKIYYLTEDYFETNKLPIFIFTPAHTNYYYTAYKIFKKNKFFGSGPKTYRVLSKKEQYAYNKYSYTTHPHNYYMQLLSETGIFGLVFILIGYISLLIIFLNNVFSKKYDKKKQNCYLILIGGLLINFFPFMPTGNFFNNWNSILILIPVSLLLKVFYDGK